MIIQSDFACEKVLSFRDPSADIGEGVALKKTSLRSKKDKKTRGGARKASISLSSSVPDLRPVFREKVPGFRDESEKAQIWIVRVFWDCVTRSRKRADGKAAFSAYLTSQHIRSICGRFEHMTKIGRKYFMGLQGDNISKKPNLYTPFAALIDAYQSCAVSPGDVEFLDNHGRARKRTKPKAAISSKTSSGGKRGGKGQLLNYLPIDVEALQSMLASSPCAACQHSIHQLLILRKSHGAAASVPIRYIQHADSGGRLFEENGVQEITRKVRSVALAGLWSYDISNCHFTLMSQLAHRRGVATPCIDDYLCNKAARRAEIRQALEDMTGAVVAAADVKEALIALAYGMSLSKFGALKTIFENAGVEYAFARNPWVLSLREELLASRRALLQQYKRKSGGFLITNAQGFRQTFGARGYGGALSFLITGVESLVLDQVLQGWGSELVLCIHDGWVARKKLPVAEIVERIERTTGFRVAIEAHQIEPVSCDRCDGREKISVHEKTQYKHEDTVLDGALGETKEGKRASDGPQGGTPPTDLTQVASMASSVILSEGRSSASTGQGPLSKNTWGFGLVLSQRCRWSTGDGYKGLTANGGRPLGSKTRSRASG